MYTLIRCLKNLLAYTYIYVCEYTSVLLCIYMHRESASDSEVDPIVKLIWSKV